MNDVLVVLAAVAVAAVVAVALVIAAHRTLRPGGAVDHLLDRLVEVALERVGGRYMYEFHDDSGFYVRVRGETHGGRSEPNRVEVWAEDGWLPLDRFISATRLSDGVRCDGCGRLLDSGWPGCPWCASNPYDGGESGGGHDA